MLWQNLFRKMRRSFDERIFSRKELVHYCRPFWRAGPCGTEQPNERANCYFESSIFTSRSVLTSIVQSGDDELMVAAGDEMSVHAHLVFINIEADYAVFRLRENTTVSKSVYLSQLGHGADVPVDARIYSAGYNSGNTAEFGVMAHLYHRNLSPIKKAVLSRLAIQTVNTSALFHNHSCSYLLAPFIRTVLPPEPKITGHRSPCKRGRLCRIPYCFWLVRQVRRANGRLRSRTSGDIWHL